MALSLPGRYSVSQAAGRLLKNGFFVILNGVKDLYLVAKTRFFATLQMTTMVFFEFFNSFIDFTSTKADAKKRFNLFFFIT